MRRRIPEHLRSNLVGYLVIFLALAGGTAYATHPGGANTISSEDIINGQVKQPDIGTDAINSPRIANQTVNDNDLEPASVKGGKVLDDSLTGADVNEDSLDLAAEAWHAVSGPGEPGFNTSANCEWANFDASHNSAAFLRDRHGTVHMKGLVKAVDPAGPGPCDFVTFPEGGLIFELPAGYRPGAREVQSIITNAALGRLNVDGSPLGPFPAGAVSVGSPTTGVNAAAWVSLDGITFRCAPSGIDGCP